MNDALLEQMMGRARHAGEKALAEAPRAKHAEYIEETDELLLELESGTTLRIPIQQMQGLRGANVDALHSFELTSDGMAIHWDELDAHFTISGLI